MLPTKPSPVIGKTTTVFRSHTATTISDPLQAPVRAEALDYEDIKPGALGLVIEIFPPDPKPKSSSSPDVEAIAASANRRPTR
jgi:hypothetical protein